jgi:hypothetical protein
MKKLLILSAIAVSTPLPACNNSRNEAKNEESGATVSGSSETRGVVAGEYVNLQSGKEVYIIPDKESGKAIDSISGEPVRFYVDTQTGDTLFMTGVVVNHQLIQSGGAWDFDPTKVELDGDEIKIKGVDSKLKAEDGDMKYKQGEDFKVKTEKDGDVKIKDGENKTKIDDGEVKKKPEN